MLPIYVMTLFGMRWHLFNGPVWASHNNCRALVNHNRQFSDEMIKALIEKRRRHWCGVGRLDDCTRLDRGISHPVSMQCNLDKVIDHIDHICQLAGNALHVGIGSDLDGAFGREQCPYDLHTIADLQTMPLLLQKRGYSNLDVEHILYGNWLRFLRTAWR